MSKSSRRTATRTFAIVLVGWVGACADRGSTEPRFERPAGLIIGLDRTLRAPTEIGGRAALRANASRSAPQNVDSAQPTEPSSAGAMWGAEPVQYYDGDYYVWSGGESYAPAHKRANIYDFVAKIGRTGNDEPIQVSADFRFDGHAASNEAEWKITTASGDVIRNRAAGSFGSEVDPPLGMTLFARRGWSALAIEYDVGCDAKVTGTTRGRAWYMGGWDIDGISIGVNPSGPNGGINFSKGKRGELESSRRFDTQFTCPPGSSGGGGDGYDGGDDCVICQQWFLPVGEDYVIEWWECGAAAPSMCDQDAI